MAVLFHREMGWNRDWMFFASAVGIYAAFVFWFGRLMNRP
jgi:hypothetical protein